MNIKQHIITARNAYAEIFNFACGKGVEEFHLMIHASNHELTFGGQLKAIAHLYEDICKNELPTDACPVFKRYFVSDAANQTSDICTYEASNDSHSVSIVQQPPLDGTKIALWCYLQTKITTKKNNSGLYESKHGSYKHFWNASAHIDADSSENQTRLLLDEYVRQLDSEGCNLAENCVRTWFFVNDIDNNYAGVVKGRNEVFDTQGLTKDTHFIASTGIGGRHSEHQTSVLLDNYAISGIRPEQIKYLYAASHLNRTSEYGVRFERGTCIDYGDRRHVFISGTASIDNKGNIMYPGDIVRQTYRMWGNVEALLTEAECTFEHVAQIIVYLRDTGDYSIVRKLFTERFPKKPIVIVWAPVCRPGWLIEMECMGIVPANNSYEPL